MRPAILCLHGFTGSPNDVGPLAAHLETAGWRVKTPLLPGHEGGRVAPDVTWQEWYGGASRALDNLRAESGGPVSVIGASMGALLAIRLASQRPSDVLSLVLLAAPLRLQPREQYGLTILTRLAVGLGMGRRATIPNFRAADVIDPEMRARVPAVREYPLSSLHTLLELMAIADADLPGVIAPALVVQGRRDTFVAASTADQIAKRLGSPIVEQLWLEESAHLVALDIERDTLAAAVHGFLGRFDAAIGGS